VNILPKTFRRKLLGSLVTILVLTSFTYAATLGEAVEYDAGVFVVNGDADWFWQDADYFVGADAARSGAISHNMTSDMEIVVSGPGTANFYWKVSSEYGYDHLNYYVDDVLVDSISGNELFWINSGSDIPAGDHVLSWKYIKDGNITSGQDCGWVDVFSFVFLTATITPTVTPTITITPTFSVTKTITGTWTYFPTPTITMTSYVTPINTPVTVNIQEALDYYELGSYSHGGCTLPGWIGQTAYFYHDGDALKSTPAGNNCSQYLYFEVFKPGEISFYWSVSSEPVNDYVVCNAGNTEVARISGSVPWTKVEYKFTEAYFMFGWNYVKNSSVAGGSDCAWIDKLVYTVYTETITPTWSITKTATITGTYTATQTITPTSTITPTITITPVFVAQNINDDFTNDIYCYPSIIDIKRGVDEITFYRLPHEGNIIIYNINGERVYNQEFIKHDGVLGLRFSRDIDKAVLSPGVYIYAIFDNNNNNKITGKFVLLR
jgi:hypothetical protein